MSISCAARSSTAQSSDGSSSNFIRLGLGAALRASVRHTEADWAEVVSVDHTEMRKAPIQRQ